LIADTGPGFGFLGERATRGLFRYPDRSRTDCSFHALASQFTLHAINLHYSN
jgi:hypothetical protein